MLIHVKIFPDSNEDYVEAKSDVSYVVKVREKAERNEANLKMRQILAKHLNIEQHRIRIVTGHHSPSKIIEIKDK